MRDGAGVRDEIVQQAAWPDGRQFVRDCGATAGRSTLEIAHHPLARTFRQATSHDGVAVTYTHFR